MNLQIHNVIRYFIGLTGLAILDAILAGERNPEKLAAQRHGRIKASAEADHMDRIAAYKEIRRGGRPNRDFFSMIAISAGIASLGVILDSAAVIIGA